MWDVKGVVGKADFGPLPPPPRTLDPTDTGSRIVGWVGDAAEADAQPDLRARMQRIAADYDDLSAQ